MTQQLNKTEVTDRAIVGPGSRLVLFPSDPHYAWNSDTVVLAELRDVGLIAERLQQNIECASYLCGERFLSLITFLGCAPNIALAPREDGQAFCHIELPVPFASPAAHFGINVKSARCPSCQNPVYALADVTEICCGRCGTPTLAWQLNWRRSACWARTIVNVCNVYESEAVPSDELLDQLTNISGVSWRYCYIRS